MDRKRRDMIAAHWLPNGDLRFFRQDAKMGGGTGTRLQLLSESFRNHHNSPY